MKKGRREGGMLKKTAPIVLSPRYPRKTTQALPGNGQAPSVSDFFLGNQAGCPVGVWGKLFLFIFMWFI